MTKVMLVEDDNNLREIYEARLQAEGYDIVAAKDGEEALVLAKEHKPELVISDVMMPKISGFEMLDILRNTDGLKDVKVIMLTALGQSDDQARADKLGADRYLVKSQVTLEDIVTVARELIDGGSAPAVAAPAAADAPPAATVTPAPAEPVATEPVKPVTPAPEPVADTPVPEPVVAPEPAAVTPAPVTPAPEPVAAPATDATTSDTTMPAQSTAQEEASVEAKIEDFVAGATSDPGAAAPATPTESEVAAEPAAVADTPVPEPVVAPEPAAVTPAPVTPAPEPVAAPNPSTVIEPTSPASPTSEPAGPTDAALATATDDKLMADAVDALMANTEANLKPLATAVTPEPPAIVTEKTPELVDEEHPKTATEFGSVPINGKKVIGPIEGGPEKPSIEALLAKEEARNIQAGAEIPPATPATPATVVKPGEVDPNSIAL